MKPPIVAYFSAEYAIDDDLPIFAGGLGVLAADVVLEAGAQRWPMVAFGAAYQHTAAAKNWAGGQVDNALVKAGFRRFTKGDGAPWSTTVDFGDWSVEAGAWERRFGETRLMLIDTNLTANTDLSRRLTGTLYDPDTATRLLQEFVIAHASLDLLDELKVQPDYYHLNEGHMAFLALVLAARYRDQEGPMPLRQALAAVRPQIVATKHTILPGAGDFADADTLRRLFGNYLQRFGWAAQDLLEAGAKASDPEVFSTTAFMLACAERSSAVSRIHAVAEREAHPGSRLIPLTNGVHQPRWQWDNLHGDLAAMDDAELWSRHQDNRRKFIEYVNTSLGSQLDPERLTIVWARRFAPYKRPLLLMEDVQRLQRLMGGDHGFQVIYSGNANEVDEEGIRILEQLIAHAQDRGFDGRLVYLPHYATDLSRWLVGGADVWLNTPIRGMEACGTSGMKAGLNGALQLSTSDGWIDEVDVTEFGWAIPMEDSAGALYHLLENEVVPLFYERDAQGMPAGWLKKLRAAVALTERQFTTKRMLEDYHKELYK